MAERSKFISQQNIPQAPKQYGDSKVNLFNMFSFSVKLYKQSCFSNFFPFVLSHANRGVAHLNFVGMKICTSSRPGWSFAEIRTDHLHHFDDHSFVIYVSPAPVLVPSTCSFPPAPHSLKCAGESWPLVPEKMRLSRGKRAEEDALRARWRSQNS